MALPDLSETRTVLRATLTSVRLTGNEIRNTSLGPPAWPRPRSRDGRPRRHIRPWPRRVIHVLNTVAGEQSAKGGLAASRSPSSWSMSLGGSRGRRCAGTARYCGELQHVGFEEAHAVLACLAGPRASECSRTSSSLLRRAVKRVSRTPARNAVSPGGARVNAGRGDVGMDRYRARRVHPRRSSRFRINERPRGAAETEAPRS